MPETLSPQERDKIIRDLRKLARLMDYSMAVPGTGLRFGLDPLLGLLPGVGDAASAAMSIYIVYQASRLGVSKRTLTLMLGNIALDFAAGSIPVLGDVFDLAFKANRRNLKLLKIDPDGFIDVKATPLR